MKPTAVARTISLFTGKTDLESSMARDGSLPEELRRRRGAKRRKWHGDFSWAYGYPAPNGGHVDSGWILADGAGYSASVEVKVVTKKTKHFMTLIQAAAWVENLVDGSRK